MEKRDREKHVMTQLGKEWELICMAFNNGFLVRVSNREGMRIKLVFVILNVQSSWKNACTLLHQQQVTKKFWYWRLTMTTAQKHREGYHYHYKWRRWQWWVVGIDDDDDRFALPQKPNWSHCHNFCSEDAILQHGFHVQLNISKWMPTLYFCNRLIVCMRLLWWFWRLVPFAAWLIIKLQTRSGGRSLNLLYFYIQFFLLKVHSSVLALTACSTLFAHLLHIETNLVTTVH